MSKWSIASLDAEADKRSCEAVVAEALARALDPAGEGGRVFRQMRGEAALAEARAHDLLRKQGVRLSPLHGLPVSIKDNADFKGSVSAAGSKVLLEGPPAASDSPVVHRLKQAGAVIMGRTNMSELAFSGVGYNPHFGTPANPYERAKKRIPGGSSAGAAVSVTDRMAVVALGTDTGGSVRIPAALTGLVGFKPTKRRVPTDGVVPLSTTLDSVGPLATSVADCALVDAIFAGEEAPEPAMSIPHLRFWFPADFMMAGCDALVQRAFERALKLLVDGGSNVSEESSDIFDVTWRMARRGTIATAEAVEHFGALIQQRRDDFDPRVAERIERGASMSAADHVANLRERAEFIRALRAISEPYDAIIAPTVPIVAPLISDIESDEGFRKANGLILRNPAVANLADRPSISIPCHATGEPPVGLMLIGHEMRDAQLLVVAATVEAILAKGLQS